MVKNNNKNFNVFYMPLNWNENVMLKNLDIKYIKKLINSFKNDNNHFTTDDKKKQMILKKYKESIKNNVLSQ